MTFELAPLPYPVHALEPVVSRRSVELHYEKHHRGYLRKLEKAVRGEPEAELSLEDLIRTAEGPVFQNAAQVWNHDLYWRSLAPDGGGRPTGALAAALERDFGSFDKFREQFITTAAGHFGSGWAWLVRHGERLRVLATHDAANPISEGVEALLGVDLWEHAYYLDYQNRRREHLEKVFEGLLHWRFAADAFRRLGPEAAPLVPDARA